jgi:hypothetical protein
MPSSPVTAEARHREPPYFLEKRPLDGLDRPMGIRKNTKSSHFKDEINDFKVLYLLILCHCD